MKGLAGVIALFVVAWVMVIHGTTRHVVKPSGLAQLGDPGELQAAVLEKSPVVIRQWEANFQQKMLVNAG